MKKIHALILAAGKGTRMGGELPKVMVKVNGKPLIGWVIDALVDAEIRDITAIVGYKKDLVIDFLPSEVLTVEQKEQLGTGHAVLCAKDSLAGFDGLVMVACGDMPLISPKTFSGLVEQHVADGNSCTVLTARIEPPHRYGRIIRGSDNQVIKIVEAADATVEELKVDEVNTAVYIFDCIELYQALEKIGSDNKQGEYYLPDVIEIMLGAGSKVGAVICENSEEALGVNSSDDLTLVEKYLLKR